MPLQCYSWQCHSNLYIFNNNNNNNKTWVDSVHSGSTYIKFVRTLHTKQLKTFRPNCRCHAPPQTLHSSDAPMLVVPRIHTALARHDLSVAAPSTWNSRSADIRLCENILSNTTWKPIYSNSLSPVFLCCIKRLCIFGPEGTIQNRYYYYYW